MQQLPQVRQPGRARTSRQVDEIHSIPSHFIADWNSGPAAGVDGGLAIRQAYHIADKFLDALHSVVSCVTGRRAATDFKFRCERREIILGPVFICIDKHKIEMVIFDL